MTNTSELIDKAEVLFPENGENLLVLLYMWALYDKITCELSLFSLGISRVVFLDTLAGICYSSKHKRYRLYFNMSRKILEAMTPNMIFRILISVQDLSFTRMLKIKGLHVAFVVKNSYQVQSGLPGESNIRQDFLDCLPYFKQTGNAVKSIKKTFTLTEETPGCTNIFFIEQMIPGAGQVFSTSHEFLTLPLLTDEFKRLSLN